MFRAAHSSGAKSEVDSKMSRVQPVCHAMWHTDCRPGRYFSQQDTVSENQSKKGRAAIDPEAAREIPPGSDEESMTDRSGRESDDSTKQATSRAPVPDADQPHGK